MTEGDHVNVASVGRRQQKGGAAGGGRSVFISRLRIYALRLHLSVLKHMFYYLSREDQKASHFSEPKIHIPKRVFRKGGATNSLFNVWMDPNKWMQKLGGRVWFLEFGGLTRPNVVEWMGATTTWGGHCAHLTSSSAVGTSDLQIQLRGGKSQHNKKEMSFKNLQRQFLKCSFGNVSYFVFK